ncbi:PspA/IM30 family protein [Kitasatospora aureofaciens]|uniref:PspA/IM30 family protein n=1 Tax=Kitasatospora aureofaciens TaxID=1894 RepID=UPI003520CC31
MASGREDLAREVLARRAGIRNQLAGLEEQGLSLEVEEGRLGRVLQRLETQTEAFRLRKETLKAEYTWAEAETRVVEAVSGVGEELGALGAAVQRATNRTEQLRARSSALDDLMASGALDNATLATEADDVRIELERIGVDRDVENDLKRLKDKLLASPETEDEREAGTRRAESGGESSA